MRFVASLLLVLFLGQSLGLPALEGPCVLAQCDEGTSSDRGDCSTPCAACLCCGPIRTLPPLDTTRLTVAPITPARLLAERDAFLPDNPPHEILHVPKA